MQSKSQNIHKPAIKQFGKKAFMSGLNVTFVLLI